MLANQHALPPPPTSAESPLAPARGIILHIENHSSFEFKRTDAKAVSGLWRNGALPSETLSADGGRLDCTAEPIAPFLLPTGTEIRVSFASGALSFTLLAGCPFWRLPSALVEGSGAFAALEVSDVDARLDVRLTKELSLLGAVLTVRVVVLTRASPPPSAPTLPTHALTQPTLDTRGTATLTLIAFDGVRATPHARLFRVEAMTASDVARSDCDVARAPALWSHGGDGAPYVNQAFTYALADAESPDAAAFIVRVSEQQLPFLTWRVIASIRVDVAPALPRDSLEALLDERRRALQKLRGLSQKFHILYAAQPAQRERLEQDMACLEQCVARLTRAQQQRATAFSDALKACAVAARDETTGVAVRGFVSYLPATFSAPGNFEHRATVQLSASRDGFTARDVPKEWVQVFEAVGLRRSDLRNDAVMDIVHEAVASAASLPTPLKKDEDEEEDGAERDEPAEQKTKPEKKRRAPQKKPPPPPPRPSTSPSSPGPPPRPPSISLLPPLSQELSDDVTATLRKQIELHRAALHLSSDSVEPSSNEEW